MRSVIAIFFMLILLPGCDIGEGISGMLEKQKLAEQHIKSKYGWESNFGYSIVNGELQQVTLVVFSNEVRQTTVEDLELAAAEAVTLAFDEKPQAIFIQIVSQPELLK
ncbi:MULTISPECIES: hypothetical protein [Pseudoalteromonas]|uniref:Uncharacterized protein n=1 Tax=Pseudoalteromonas luteoviolacea (strain 2ta16) TaxID=1353533 RepID=V4HNS7_PSEL2|nr:MULTISPECIES: hypothetical protein [Pseudoalteromonas]ESP91413.1 hypothetical protein PL2TA16_00212 [Pseudoalteromonas luteoviolacea 2ta16]KZN40060.1 hypothetical protein N483_17895 [Pseudoalteromonas luteoviolacea NCIMB 1944]MCG7551535.1 hypothetical protein [Pseudoalteromonas sp. Of7M-16]